MDLPIFKRAFGYIALRDFPGDIIKLFQEEGFVYHSRVCIWKDPLIAATRTKALGLAHKQLCKDSALCNMGTADTLLAFRKRGDNPTPCRHPSGLTEYYGSATIPRDLESFIDCEDNSKNKRSQWIWQRFASPVWMDIRQTRVLPFRQAKESDDTKHVCPLQLDVIERCVALWSARGDTFLTPFMGVGSEVYVAVKNGLKAIGIELKKSYYRQALANLYSLQKKKGLELTTENGDD